MVRIFKKKNFNIYLDDSGSYIIHNVRKEFSSAHIHINNFNTAKYIVNLAFTKSLPNKKISNYLIDSIITVSTDPVYIKQLKKYKRG